MKYLEDYSEIIVIFTLCAFLHFKKRKASLVLKSEKTIKPSLFGERKTEKETSGCGNNMLMLARCPGETPSVFFGRLELVGLFSCKS